MNILTLLEVAVLVFCVATHRGLTPVLAIGGITAAGAALTLGRVVVPTFYAAAGAAAAAVIISFVLRSGGAMGVIRLPPGFALLALFSSWAIAITLLSPLVISGLVGDRESTTSRGLLTVSNVAQIIYLILALGLILYVAYDRRVGPGVLGLTSVGATILSFWRYLAVNAGVPFPEGLFDNSPAATFIESAPDNVQRFRGIFSEPAGLAQSCLVATVWCLCTLPGSTRAGRFWRLLVTAAAVYLGVISTSTTFILAAPLVGLVGVVVALIHVLKRETRIPLRTSILGVVLVVTLIIAIVPVSSYIRVTVDAKLGTSSYDERTSSNGSLYSLFVNSWGIGGGLGTERGSSFIATLAGTTGLLGVLLLSATIVFYISQGLRSTAYRPVVWVLVTVLIVKAVAGPDLADTSGLLWLSLGLLAQCAVLGRVDSGRSYSSLVTRKQFH